MIFKRLLFNFCWKSRVIIQRLAADVLWLAQYVRRYAVDVNAGDVVEGTTRFKSDTQSGMTLIELIITLTILAAVASIAIVTLSDMGQTSRYEETSRRGAVAQRAVIGEPGEVSRFVNDMGRYPMVLVDMTSAGDDDIKEQLSLWYLAELYNIEADDEVNGTQVFVYDATEASAVRSRICYADADFNFDFDANGTATSDSTRLTTAAVINNRQVAMKAGWNGPYLINQYESFTDNYGQPWSVNVGTNAVNDVWDADWTTYRRNSDGTVELEIVPILGDQITAIRSDFKVKVDSGGFYNSGDFSSTEEESSYANEVEDLTFPFYDSHVFAELTVNLHVQDYSGIWMSASGARTSEPETNKYDRARVMLYVPLCERAAQPQLCEISGWYNGGLTTNLGVRYRSWDGSVYVNDYSYYAQDGNGDGKFTSASPDTSGFVGTIPDVMRTRCEVTGVSAATGTPPLNGVSEVTFSNVPVGRRKIWAYIYSSEDAAIEDGGERYSHVQTVEIKLGHNVVDLYLTESGF